MTWGTLTGGKRCVQDREKQPLILAAVWIVTAGAAFSSQRDAAMGGGHRLGVELMAGTADLFRRCVQEVSIRRGMGGMATRAAIQGSCMGCTLDPVCGNLFVAAEAELWFRFVQVMFAATVTGMAGQTRAVAEGLVDRGRGGCGCDDTVMASGADLFFRACQQEGAIAVVRQVAFFAVFLSVGGMVG